MRFQADFELIPRSGRKRKFLSFNGRRVPWETCRTFSGSWGYYRDETTWKSPAHRPGGGLFRPEIFFEFIFSAAANLISPRNVYK
jgi:hypothetical protein